MKDFNSEIGFSPKMRDALNYLGLTGSLPIIRGKWYFVDPYAGSNSNGGESIDKAVADLPTAYGFCTSGAGDGIVLLSGGTSSSNTTSYLDSLIAWSKHAITVVGVAAPTTMFGRARVSSKVRVTGALTTIAFVDTSSVYTITDSAEGFVTAGFVVGSTIEVIANSGTNDGVYTITVVAAGTLTVTESVTTENAATAGSTTITSYQASLITVSGDNNAFYNVHIANYGTSQYAVGGLKVTGNRNAFINVHGIGGGHATPAATTGMYSLHASGEENTYVSCTFGTDTIIRAAANGEILFDGTMRRNKFVDCRVISYSVTAGKGAIKSADATSIDGWTVFKGCSFTNWNTGDLSALTSAFIGTNPNNLGLLMTDCSLIGWAAWDSVGGNDRVYVTNSAVTASGAGGIATTV